MVAFSRRGSARISSLVLHLRSCLKSGTLRVAGECLNSFLVLIFTALARMPKPIMAKWVGLGSAKEVLRVVWLKVAYMSPSSAFLEMQTMDLLSVRWRKAWVCNAAVFWS